MFDHIHYVPILRWKRAERGALRDLKPDINQRVTPLIEPTSWAFSDRNLRKPKTPDQKISKIAEDIMQDWGQAPFFMDFLHVPPSVRSRNGHAFSTMGSEARSRQLHLIPVIGLRRTDNYQEAVASICATDGLGMCVRLLGNELKSPSVVADLESMLARIELQPEQVDLLVDYQFVDQSCPIDLTLSAKIPHLNRWRTFTVTSGAFPENLRNFRLGISKHPRLDWLSWRNHLESIKNSSRIPTLGDYTIQYPHVPDPPTFGSPSASIRYTAEDSWVIMRGESVRKDDGPGYAQWPANAQMLRDLLEFKGANYSEGDNYIDRMGQQDKRTGNPETWLRAGFNHHMTLVAKEIASLFGNAIDGVL